MSSVGELMDLRLITGSADMQSIQLTKLDRADHAAGGRSCLSERGDLYFPR